MGIYVLVVEEAQLGFALISNFTAFPTSKLQSDYNTECTAVVEHGVGITCL